jgi:hypothetical protein
MFRYRLSRPTRRAQSVSSPVFRKEGRVADEAHGGKLTRVSLFLVYTSLRPYMNTRYQSVNKVINFNFVIISNLTPHPPIYLVPVTSKDLQID